MAVKRVTHPSVEERTTRGKEVRTQTPPGAHTGWKPATDRPDPVGLLEQQDATREPDLAPVRHGRMMVSPSTFYRGAAKIMAADLKDTPRTGLTVQLCGDAHLSNFGMFGSPERRLLFDLNDFDETLWVPKTRPPQATWMYSWISPPRRSTRRTRTSAAGAGGGTAPCGGAWPSARWGPMLVVVRHIAQQRDLQMSST
jgi:Uncharacterized protein conserved in bacteria (DUF2252)